MLSRRHIRIKVFQSLYSYSQQNKDVKFDINKEFNNNLIAYLNLYYLIIDILTALKETSKEEIIIKKNQFIPKEEDLNPNKKFIKNIILKKTKRIKQDHIDYDKLKSIIKNIFKKIKNGKTYKNYMSSTENTYSEDRQLINHLLTNYLLSDKRLHDLMEEHSIYWNDDLIIVYNILLEKLNNNQSINNTKLFRQSDDRIFANELLKKTIKNTEKTSKIIYDLAKNWDKERIAISDLIIMRMAITEMTYIQNIPHKVTIDEYIEISKQYSTPKSKEFINGILDVFIKDILPKKINKS